MWARSCLLSPGCSARALKPTSEWFGQSPESVIEKRGQGQRWVTHPHGVRILVGEKSQESCEAAESSCEQYEERKLLLRVDRHLMTKGMIFGVKIVVSHTS